MRRTGRSDAHHRATSPVLRKRPTAARAWIDAWATCIPGCDPARALSIAGPLAHLTYAVRYQEFLDGIEPAERIYHLGDPAAAIRAALRSARDLT